MVTEDPRPKIHALIAKALSNAVTLAGREAALAAVVAIGESIDAATLPPKVQALMQRALHQSTPRHEALTSAMIACQFLRSKGIALVWYAPPQAAQQQQRDEAPRKARPEPAPRQARPEPAPRPVWESASCSNEPPPAPQRKVRRKARPVDGESDPTWNVGSADWHRSTDKRAA